ncbi:alpha/beta fold hydrolase [Gordonia sp. (in: high G+C Gram-positive bacteria)]|uniref:esterase/lipase family protein n=1 Tax=Gordonia sp. (in: high G+C Gram-positive bacteria) TaxID=84139 RepID=UPI0016A465D9|nr:alpha/beta fold hydrolase [Gordonia sp. (in: high G+C Gram-positive bacteria)]NLG46918.1 triacylglycerol lipase [Gordonia sp. (in: high G+C Gram-positive bacteria)]
MNILHSRWGRPVSDVITAGIRVGQWVAAPALKVGQAVVQKLPLEHLVSIGDEQQQANNRIVYDFFSGIGPELANPGGALPGANQWDVPCSPEHPVPVILVHGTAGGGQTNWGTYVPLLVDAGFSVFTLTYGALEGAKWPISALGGMKRIEDSAREFGEFAEKVMASTGATQVDVVGHSQGTIVPGYWAKFLGGESKIRRYVSLAPLWEGTSTLTSTRPLTTDLKETYGIDVGAVIPCHALPQMMAGSHFLEKLNFGGSPYVQGIEYTNISTAHDELVRPYTSGQVVGLPDDNVTNIVLQDGCAKDFSDHLGICGSPRAAAMVLNALEGEDLRLVPCRLVAPFFGSPIMNRTAGAPDLIAAFAPSHIS